MRFTLKKACKECPFRRAPGAVRLVEDRIYEITDNLLRGAGMFQCHKTVKRNDEDEAVMSRTDQFCFGALAFAYKNDEVGQLIRIAERTGAIDIRFARNPDPKDEFFDDVDEMLAHALPIRRSKRAGARSKR